MKVSLKKVDKLNGIITIDLEKGDYQEKVEEALKQRRKDIKIPGFRQGKVPIALVQKMYGKAILIDEVHKVLQHTLIQYISKENIKLLGNPLPQKNQEINWDNKEFFSFYYDVGFAPEVKVNLNRKKSIHQYKIIANETHVDHIVKDVLMRNGSFVEVKKVARSDRIFARFVELEKDQLVKKSGLMYENYFFVSSVNTKLQKLFIGLRKNDALEIDLLDTFSDKHQLANLINIEEDKLTDLSNKFKIIVLSVTRINPAEINKKLFDKIYGLNSIKTEKEFRHKIQEDAEQTFQKDSDNKLLKDARECVLAQNPISLPDIFLKRWLISVNPLFPNQW